jgi:hypothetical protein
MLSDEINCIKESNLFHHLKGKRPPRIKRVAVNLSIRVGHVEQFSAARRSGGLPICQAYGEPGNFTIDGVSRDILAAELHRAEPGISWISE